MENNVLVYAATNEQGYGSGIFMLDELFHQPIKIDERDTLIAVNSLASHDNVLYDSWFQVGKTLSGNIDSKRDGLYGRPHRSQAIASHNDKLYESSWDECLYERLTGDALEGILIEADGNPTFPHYSQQAIVERSNLITDLVSHNDDLYDAGGYGVLNTFSGEEISDRTTFHLASDKGTLYGSGPGISDWPENEIYEILTASCRPTEIRIAYRSSETRALVSHRRRLYDAGNYGILDTMLNQIREDSIVPHSHVSAMASVPRKIFEEAGILK